MNEDERLFCRCGGEVRIVRLNARYLTLGHVSGGQRGHYVRLARPAAVDVHSSTRGASDWLRGHRRLTEEPDLRRGAEVPQTARGAIVPGSDPTDAIPVASNLRATSSSSHRSRSSGRPLAPTPAPVSAARAEVGRSGQ